MKQTELVSSRSIDFYICCYVLTRFLKDSWGLDDVLKLKRKDVFAKILSDVIIWDSGKK